MEIINSLKIFFKGWGWYLTFFTLASWIYIIFLLLFLFIQVALLLFKVKYKNQEFEDYINKLKDK
jgi:hypothetical protein